MGITIKAGENQYDTETDKDKTILELARSKNIFIKTSCGGNGTCGSCLCNLEMGTFTIKKNTQITVDNKPVKALACVTRILSEDAVVSIPESSIIEMSGNIIDDFILTHYVKDVQTVKFCVTLPEVTLGEQISDRQRLEKELHKQASIHNIHIPLDVLKKLPGSISQGDNTITVSVGRVRNFWFMVNIEPGTTIQSNFAVAVDLGTTTVVGILVDLVKGEIVGRASLYNQQIHVADDVVTRISYCKTQQEVDTLQELINLKTINPILSELCKKAGISKDSINRMAVSGNTVMTHLFLGLNPVNIGKAPFKPVTQHPGEFQAKEMGLNINDNGIIDVMPSISGYIGSDITSDIYVSKLHQQKDLTVLIDIGTNGEIVFSENGTLIACSTAAGPAFEGYGLYHGCRASAGSIEKISFTKSNKIEYKTIGGHKPGGICGTGYIDFIAEGLKAGFINESGRFDHVILKEQQLNYSVTKDGRTFEGCVIAKQEDSSLDESVVILESDIAKILQAKAAIYAGLQTILKVKNKGFNDIGKIILAGGFARHIIIENAVRIGLLPDLPENKIEVIGNGSLGGSFLSLIELYAIDTMTRICSIPEVIELNLRPDFQTNYIEAMFLSRPGM